MKVLFLGCGDIGLRAIDQLQEKNRQQGAGFVCHGARRQINRLPESLSRSSVDICDSESLTTLLDEHRFDAVVVTLTPLAMSDEGYRDSYVAGARSLSLAVQHAVHPPGLVVWISSSGVYGQDQGEWVDEESATRPVSYRGKRLLEAEDIIQALPITSCIVRFSGIYGPGRGRLLQQVREGRLAPPQPVQWSNRIHADDAAGVLVHLLGKYKHGENIEPLYLATDNEPIVIHEVHVWLAREMGVDGLSPAAEKTSLVVRGGNRRCNNQRLRDSGFVFRYPTFREGYRELLSPTDGE
ncbi:sugar nucleotide-binding protein [Porticoccus litoralis]|uniref:Sugar nucleotide-binding protein n=1 Tax=Porticoccus litoralis TaxID=434086 RepID=A0AAW8B7Y6_9GAMM|nr:sugar nucleotide-binding protein [Porticoccus litoralis]MDP1520843.1 sugar nucleotide-binding protein [Porticoccus litoralis]